MNNSYWGKKKDGPTIENNPKPTSTVSDTTSTSDLFTSANRIQFVSNITEASAAKLSNELRNLDMTLQQSSLSYGIPPIPIELRISSYGGSIFAGLSVMDTILNCVSPVHTYVDGYVASAGTFLSLVGTRRFMGKNSFILIHQLSSAMWGKMNELEDDMKNNKRLMKLIRGFYLEYTKVPKGKLNEILKHDLWWDAETCLKFGLVDEIV